MKYFKEHALFIVHIMFGYTKDRKTMYCIVRFIYFTGIWKVYKVYLHMQGTFIRVDRDRMALSHSHYVIDMGYFNANQ
jgi:hypothetical protein